MVFRFAVILFYFTSPIKTKSIFGYNVFHIWIGGNNRDYIRICKSETRKKIFWLSSTHLFTICFFHVKNLQKFINFTWIEKRKKQKKMTTFRNAFKVLDFVTKFSCFYFNFKWLIQIDLKFWNQRICGINKVLFLLF